MERAAALSPPERAAFVARETSDDPDLGVELTALLDASEGAEAYVSWLRQELMGSDVRHVLPLAAEAPDPWIGRTVSHYEILDRIGGGGMGVVYRARDVKLDRPVALKFIAPELRRDTKARRRFLHEARAASALDHPNICTIHEIAETDDGRSFIVMAAYEGETLRRRLERGSLSDRDALRACEQIARALATAHERGIVHRDVKPDNVFLTRDGVVKLLDFGLARTAGSRMSGAGTVGGTVAYMSPEQARGARADERSDVWALGVILFEMLAGVRPFDASDARETVHQILTVEPDLRAKRPDLPQRTIDVVHRALSRDPKARFVGAGQFLEALLGAEPLPDTAAAAQRRRGRRTWWIGAVTAGLALVVTIVSLRIHALPRADRAVGGGTPVSPHVLWVDDDPSNNRFIIEQFAGRGVEVTTALSTTEALERYEPGAYDLVISDMGRYEGIDGAYVPRAGLRLLETLRVRDPNVRLVFCTSARAVAQYRDEALAAGARDIVTECEVILRLLGLEPRSPG
jgi:CheY-like chemotaxis protein